MEKKKFSQEFKEFIAKGNVIDMAVGVMMGGAFGKIVTSLVDDVIMPLISTACGGVDFTTWKTYLSGSGDTAVYLNYGSLIQNIINFLIIALCIFFFVKFMNKMRKPKVEEEAAPVISDETKALNEIITILKKDQK